MLSSKLFAQDVNFDWLKTISGPQNEVLTGVCVDLSGNTYASGWFLGNPSFENKNMVSKGASDLVMIKLDSSGRSRWVKSFGSVSFDFAFDIDCDQEGNVFLTGGYRQNIDFSPDISLSSSGELDLFTARFDSEGNCIWAKSATGLATDYGNEMATSDNGCISVLGNTNGKLIFETDTLDTDSADVFIVHYDDLGNESWVGSISGNGSASGRAICIDQFKNTIVAGSFNRNLSIGPFPFTSHTPETNDIFIAKYASNGQVVWARHFGDWGDDYARGVGTDAEGNIYLSGVFSGTVDFDGPKLTANGPSDIYLMKLNEAGKAIWIKQMGGTGDEEGCEIEVKPSGEVFLTGSFGQTITLGANTFTSSGKRDVFIAKTDSSGHILWARAAGGYMDDVSYAIGLHKAVEDVITIGTYSGIFSDGSNSVNSVGGADGYISKITSSFLTGSNDFRSKTEMIKIYPNPADDVIHAACMEGYQIYSMSGKMLMHHFQAVNEINVSDLPAGDYILKTSNRIGRFSKK